MPKKSLGQNFLNDTKTLSAIVESGNISENDIIFSGTPKGVDKLKVGDKLEGHIENEKILNINII